MKLQPHYPRTFTLLILLAFILVELPLLGGMLNTVFILDKLVREGRRSVATTVTVTRTTRQLADGVDDLERAAVQNYVLEDPKLLQPVVEAHHQLQQSISVLGGEALEPNQRQMLERFASAESRLYQQLGARQSGDSDKLASITPRFDQLHAMAVDMIAEGNHVIDHQLGTLRNTADSAQQTLIWQAVAMIPLSLLLALLFSWLINRPVRQLDQAIRRLGLNDLAPGQAITGPRDLVYLGEQIDWLRRRLIELEAQEVLFLRHVSHELKTPLSAIREGVELLTDKVGGELTPQQEEITQIMRSNARELQRLIEQLIGYSREIHQPERIVPEPVSLDTLLADVLHRSDLVIQSKALKIDALVQGIQLYGDRKKLETVFNNLLSNSLRFSPHQGRVEVRAAVQGQATRITICDEGPGVPEDDRPHIFQPFFKGRLQPSASVRGSGLGLAIVKEYVEAHDGRVSLVEQPPWGACFEVVFAIPEEVTE